jgi:hypothetical protein
LSALENEWVEANFKIHRAVLLARLDDLAK